MAERPCYFISCKTEGCLMTKAGTLIFYDKDQLAERWNKRVNAEEQTEERIFNRLSDFLEEMKDLPVSPYMLAEFKDYLKDGDFE